MMKLNRKQKLVLVPLCVLVALFGCCYLVGELLPMEHTAKVSALVPGSPEQVWNALTDIGKMPRWRHGVKSVRVIEPGEHARWIEDTDFGRLPMKVIDSDAPHRLVAGIDDDSLPFGGTWTWEIEPSPGGSTVTVTENGKVKPPLFRFMSKYVFGQTATMQTYVDDLRRHLAKGEN